jgi:magnesium-transporting ATPase (P-type)
VIIIAIGLGLSLPILPVQILWVNMITAVVLGLPLAFEPGSDDVMRRKPRDVDAPLLSLRLLVRALVAGGILVAGVFLVYTFELDAGHSVEVARTAAANALIVMEAFYLFNCRRLAIIENPAPLKPNPFIWLGIGVTLLLQLLFTYAPFMQTFFKTAAIGWTTWMISVFSGIVLLLVIELEKRVRARSLR